MMENKDRVIIRTLPDGFEMCIAPAKTVRRAVLQTILPWSWAFAVFLMFWAQEYLYSDDYGLARDASWMFPLHVASQIMFVISLASMTLIPVLHYCAEESLRFRGPYIELRRQFWGVTAGRVVHRDELWKFEVVLGMNRLVPPWQVSRAARAGDSSKARRQKVALGFLADDRLTLFAASDDRRDLDSLVDGLCDRYESEFGQPLPIRRRMTEVTLEKRLRLKTIVP